MHRRHLLELVGASTVALAGCSESSGSTRSVHTSTTSTDHPATSSSTRAPVSERSLGFDVVVKSQSTDAHPARVAVSVTNESATELTYPVWPPDLDTGNRVPFDDFRATAGQDGRLFLIPDYRARLSPGSGDVPLVPATPTAGCWKAGYDELLHVTIGPQRATLQPGESFRETYSVLRASSTDCSRAVTAEFSTQKSVTSRGNEYAVTLSLTLRIAADGTVSVRSRDVVVSAPTPG